eukprot:scaffold204178_cov18-Prasinocladus_malaysianus.AAC.1
MAFQTVPDVSWQGLIVTVGWQLKFLKDCFASLHFCNDENRHGIQRWQRHMPSAFLRPARA